MTTTSLKLRHTKNHWTSRIRLANTPKTKMVYMNSTLDLINHYIVERNTNDTHLDGKWLVIGVNTDHGIRIIDSWLNTKKVALAIAKDYNDYLAMKVSQ